MCGDVHFVSLVGLGGSLVALCAHLCIPLNRRWKTVCTTLPGNPLETPTTLVGCQLGLFTGLNQLINGCLNSWGGRVRPCQPHLSSGRSTAHRQLTWNHWALRLVQANALLLYLVNFFHYMVPQAYNWVVWGSSVREKTAIVNATTVSSIPETLQVQNETPFKARTI